MKKINLDIDTLNFQKDNHLVTAVVQDGDSGTILMVGYQNREAVEKTTETGRITFWSRTKMRLWTKGETSGNFLEVKRAQVDCDQDSILYLVKAPKLTCHTGSFSCFGEKKSFNFLSELFERIQDRKKKMPQNSYVAGLFTEGLDRIAQKVGEEAVETVIAAKNDNKEDFLNESADLLFHLMVLCAEKHVDFQEVIEQLEIRS